MNNRTGRKVILHIGAQKTATTYLQKFCHNNRALLAEQSILYPDSILNRFAHHSLFYYFFKADRLTNNPPVPASTIRNSPQHIESEIRGSGARTIVLSSEDLSNAGKPHSRFDFPEFVSFLGQFGVSSNDISVIYFIRRPDEWAESRFNQQVKRGAVDLTKTSVHEFVTKFDDDISGKATINYWEQLVGSEAIRVIPFERNQFRQGIEHRFISELGGTWDSRFRASARKNTRLSRDCLTYISSIAYQTAQETQLRTSKQWQALRKLEEQLEKYTEITSSDYNEEYWLSPQERLELIRKYELVHQEIAQRYLGLKSGESLFTNPMPEMEKSWRPYPGLSKTNKQKIEHYLQQDRVK